MKVLEYTAHNIMKVSDIKFDMAGHHLYLVGGVNGQGKTSAITALLMALCGKSGFDYPEVALKDGEQKGWVKVKLSGDEELHEPEGLTIELFLRRKRDGQVIEEFHVLDSAGQEAPEPRTLLKRLCEMRGFDPLAFERMDKKAKRDLLAKLLGLDFTAEKAAHKKAYDERTRVGNDGKKLKAQYDAMPSHDGAPEREIMVSDLMLELERANTVNDNNANERRVLADHERQNAKLWDNVKSSESKINELARMLDEEKKREAQWRGQAEEDDDALGKHRESVAQLVGIDTTEIAQKIKASGDINAKVRANRSKADKKAELEIARKAYEALDKSIGDIQQQMSDKLQSAPWPVPGLSLDENGVLLDGLPIEQACKSRRIDVSVEIGMALNPKLRLLVCQDGGDLDTDSLQALGKKLEERDFQMLLELVTRSETDEALCAVVIKDGAVEPSEAV